MRRLVGFFSLFTSLSTLICCALPALFVSLGLGAIMAGLATNVPSLIWVSEHKVAVFTCAGLMLAINGAWLWSQRNAPCPVDPDLRDACLQGRTFSKRIYFASLAAFSTGGFFAYVAPLF